MTATPGGRMAVGYQHRRESISSLLMVSCRRQCSRMSVSFAVGYLSDGRSVVLNDDNVTSHYTHMSHEKLDVTFDNLSFDEGGTGGLTVDSNYLIYVVLQESQEDPGVLTSRWEGDQGDTMRWVWYLSRSLVYNDLLIIKYAWYIEINWQGWQCKTQGREIKHFTQYTAVTQNNSILIAWVKHEDGLVSIDEYTGELKHVQTLISDHKIEKPERNWYYLLEFRSREIAFCTPDRLYIFKLTITPCIPWMITVQYQVIHNFQMI